MTDHDFRAVQVLLVDRDSNIRRLLRGILARMGMSAITEFATVQEAGPSLSGTLLDLVLVEADPPEGDGFRFIQALRHSQAATNPFAGVIATTWQPTQALMVRFGASGADDLLVKPFSAKQVHDRVANIVENRKPFVVTSEYVGPDRRKAPREGQQIPLVDVPNTLRQKALGLFDRSKVGEAIAKGLADINDQKVVRHGFQVAFLVIFALPGLSQDPPDRMALEHLLRVAIPLEDLLRRLAATELRSQVETYAHALRLHLDKVRLQSHAGPEEVEALRRAAVGLAALTARRADVEVVEQEVRVAVNSYRARLDQIAQAKAAQAAPEKGTEATPEEAKPTT